MVTNITSSATTQYPFIEKKNHPHLSARVRFSSLFNWRKASTSLNHLSFLTLCSHRYLDIINRYLDTTSTGCLRKNALLGFLNPWDRLMPVVTIVLVKVVGGMLDDD